MKESLQRRLPKASHSFIEQLANILTQYQIAPTVKNIDEHGFSCPDLKGRNVRFVDGELRNKSIYIPRVSADILVIITQGLIAGWCDMRHVIDLEDRFEVLTKTLAPLPDKFEFDQDCSHLSDHGGITVDGKWECLGCGKLLVFT